MFAIGPIGFALPWLLLGLLVLPILWLLLRAVPPAPIRRRFPGVALLLGLRDEESQSDRTPWWLLLLRMLAAAAVIVGFAGPILNPQAERGGGGAMLILLDGSWADARDWPRRSDRIAVALDEAARTGRPVAVMALTDVPEGGPQFLDAEAWEQRLPSIQPAPWEPAADIEWVAEAEPDFDTLWLSDGLARPGREELLAALEARGDVRVFEGQRPILALRPARFVDGAVAITALRAQEAGLSEIEVAAVGLDPAGIERQLARLPLAFEAGTLEASGELVLPPELRNRVTRFEIAGLRSAGAVTLTDDALKRREVALIAGDEEAEALDLLSPLHYLRQALSPSADLIDGTVGDILLANPDVIVLADVGALAPAEREDMLDWVEDGGLLLRFAGPQLAASDLSRSEEADLMPVRLRAGGRTIGGAMSWGEPKTLAPFPDGSPFEGLAVPEDVTVSAQVMAQPDPTLVDRVIAQLADGTPLVTRKAIGQGQVVLFHVTANADWSTLPLSGLFVEMLERLAVLTRPVAPEAEDLEGTVWTPEEVMDAFGVVEPVDTLPGVEGPLVAEGDLGPDLQPGLYAGDDRRLAVNVTRDDTELAPADWPGRIDVEGLDVTRELDIKGWLLGGALLLLLADLIASLALSGRLRGPRAGLAVLALSMVALGGAPGPVRAQDAPEAAGDDRLAVAATSEVVLGYVITGDADVDAVSEAGLFGLSDTLFRRTSIEPAAPIGVDIERDELAFFPFLYWPVTAGQPIPSRAAYIKLNRYLSSGGMILFDTRDADIAGFGSSSPEGRKLQALARPLDIPPLEPIPQDHVLTRTFYLLQDFPGRHNSRDVWVEAADPDAEQVEGMPFRDGNDGVTPVVIGGNDWAAAWAIDDNGNRMFPIGRGMAGERQREISLRFGVNLIMHVLTGNYKSDQVHVPALLDRLGN